MKKKWIALLIMVMATCFACSCGGTQSNSSSNDGSQEYSSVQSNDKENTSSEDGGTSETPDNSSEEESGVNGGRLDGDNDLDWNA